SPQPAQAPENSKSGSSNCESFTCVCDSLLRSSSGSDRKNSQFVLSGLRSGAWSSMLMALCFTSLLLFAGQTSTHSLQPVQSSGATCNVYFRVSNSRQRGLEDLKVAGASFSSEESYTFARITACGQTRTHLPHWMHNASHQTGIYLPMLRFSRIAVPGDNCPEHIAHKFWRVGRYGREHVKQRRHLARDLDLVQMRNRRIHGCVVLLNDGFAALAIGIRNRFLDGGNRLVPWQHAANGEEAGLHDGVDAATHACGARHGVAVNHIKPQLFPDDDFLRLLRHVIP